MYDSHALDGMFQVRAETNEADIRKTNAKVYDKYGAEHFIPGPGEMLNMLAADILKEFKGAE